MFSLRRSFVLSLAFTGIVLLFLVACSLESATKPAATATPVAATPEVASTAATSVPEAGTVATQAITTTAAPRVPQGGTLTVRIPAPIDTLTERR